MRRVALLSAVLFVAACTADSSDPAGPFEPANILAGPTDTVVVACPANLVDGETGPCVAYGYDAMGIFTTSDASWATTTPSIISTTETTSGADVAANHLAQGTGVVRATIEGVLGEADIGVSLSTLSISIAGEDEVEPNTQCMWWAQVTGGTPAFSPISPSTSL